LLKIIQSELAEIQRHAEQAYPEECCGVLLGNVEGEVRRAISAVRCGNAAAGSRRTRYEIDPQQLIQVQREGRERGHEIIGFYHSHPDHPAEWSAGDLSDAYWAGCSYVIVRVEQGKAGELKSFELTRGDGKGVRGEDVNRRFVAEKIEIV
jgi:proteasome lid subunit RPN8/RPN11